MQKFTDSTYYHIYQILKNDLGVTELARRLGLNRTTLYHWENGRAFPTATTGGRLERVFGEFMDGKIEKIELELARVKEQYQESKRKK